MAFLHLFWTYNRVNYEFMKRNDTTDDSIVDVVVNWHYITIGSIQWPETTLTSDGNCREIRSILCCGVRERSLLATDLILSLFLFWWLAWSHCSASFRFTCQAFTRNDQNIETRDLDSPAEDFRHTSMRYSQLSWDIARSDPLMGQFHDSWSDDVWKWSSVDKNSSQLIYTTMTFN